MSLTRAATIPSPCGFTARLRALGPLVAWTLACCVWFAGRPLLAIDLDAVQDREAAVSTLEQARESLDQARVHAIAARQRLDAFLSGHFDAQQNPQPPVQLRFVEPDEDSLELPDPKLAQLEMQLEELHVYRGELLGYLTEEHPQVFDVDVRISTVEQQIASLGGATTAPDDGQSAHEAAESERQWREYLEQLARQGEQDAAEYRQLYETWQTAELAVDRALQAEALATQRVQAIALEPRPATEETPAGESAGPIANFSGKLESSPLAAFGESDPDAQPAATASHDSIDRSTSTGSQPLALAALLIALVVAAVTAVRLARSTADPLFASADEVAAALAIPVVGIIPATAARLQRGRPATTRQRSWVLPAQILLAVLVFAAIAYAVQSPDGLWRLCQAPFEALGSFVRSIGN